MMSRPFTTREKVLFVVMAVLILAALYIKFVYLDVNATVSQAPQLISDAQDQLAVEQAKNQNIKKMQTELQGNQTSGRTMSEIPDYDNSQAPMIELNGILIKADTYNVNFMPLSQTGNIVRRQMQLSFTAADYDTAESIIKSISESKYRNLITSLSMTSKDNDVKNGTVNVSVSVTYFELGKAANATDTTGKDTKKAS